MNVININGVFYVKKENENGIYLERVNADGTPYVEIKPQYTEAELASLIYAGPAPNVIEVVKKQKRWYQRLFHRISLF